MFRTWSQIFLPNREISELRCDSYSMSKNILLFSIRKLVNKAKLWISSQGEDHALCFGGMSRRKGKKWSSVNKCTELNHHILFCGQTRLYFEPYVRKSLLLLVINNLPLGATICNALSASLYVSPTVYPGHTISLHSIRQHVHLHLGVLR